MITSRGAYNPVVRGQRQKIYMYRLSLMLNLILFHSFYMRRGLENNECFRFFLHFSLENARKWA